MVIGGYCELLLRGLGDDERARGRLVQIRDAAQRAAALTRLLLAFSRQQILKQIQALLTESLHTTDDELSLLVKKPDYLGNSRWEFRLGDRTIEARIEDSGWLERFHKGEETLRPGHALRALVRTEVARGFEGQEVTSRYTVLKVLGVVAGTEGNQGHLQLAE